MKTCRFIVAVFSFAVISFGCKRQEVDQPVSPRLNKEVHEGYKTKNVIIIMVDGPRFSETWGDPNHKYIPNMANTMSAQGVIYNNFYNNGPTYTSAGHTAVSTGNYQHLNNGGKELPKMPSIFQYFLSEKKESFDKAWVIASKDKLEVLADCKETNWNHSFNPSTNCGNNGLGTGYRKDSETFNTTIKILKNYQPKLVLINFKEPDVSGHSGNWDAYINGIRTTDKYVYEIWKFIQSNSYYKGTTTLFVTNDHGRHLNGVKDGFVSHSCSCEGCRHINLYAFGPDFKKGIVENVNREQIDIPATVAELLDFNFPTSNGKIMRELFINTIKPKIPLKGVVENQNMYAYPYFND